jgi:hypothetical protein
MWLAVEPCRADRCARGLNASALSIQEKASRMRAWHVMLLSTIVALTFLVMPPTWAGEHSGHVMVTPADLQWADIPSLDPRGESSAAQRAPGRCRLHQRGIAGPQSRRAQYSLAWPHPAEPRLAGASGRGVDNRPVRSGWGPATSPLSAGPLVGHWVGARCPGELPPHYREVRPGRLSGVSRADDLDPSAAAGPSRVAAPQVPYEALEAAWAW